MAMHGMNWNGDGSRKLCEGVMSYQTHTAHAANEKQDASHGKPGEMLQECEWNYIIMKLGYLLVQDEKQCRQKASPDLLGEFD